MKKGKYSLLRWTTAGRKPSNNSSKTGHEWIPTSLDPRFFLGCAFMFFGMIITLEVLFRVSEQRQGLVSTSKDNHFYWTYGPTAGTQRIF